jgi:hypothetical protein
VRASEFLWKCSELTHQDTDSCPVPDLKHLGCYTVSFVIAVQHFGTFFCASSPGFW